MRLKNQMALWPLTVPVLLCFAACDMQVPQEVVGTLIIGDAPATNVEVHLYAAEACEGAAMRASTNTGGEFRFTTESTRGGIGVVTQSLTLCVSNGAGEEKLWSSTHGGGAGRITLTCHLSPAEKKGCNDAFRYGNKDA